MPFPESKFVLKNVFHKNDYFKSFCSQEAKPLTRAPTGGAVIRPPPRFIVKSEKTAARSAAKFGMTIFSLILHMVCKFKSRNFLRSGHQVTSNDPNSNHFFATLSRRVRATVDNGV